MKKKQPKSIKIQVGQTLETNDIYLPHDKRKPPQSKSRPVIVIETNKKQELVIVPGSTKKTNNTTFYGKHGIQYYRHNIELYDNEGKPIKQNKKFKLTKRCSKLPENEARKIENKVVHHSKFSSENKKKLKEFQNKNNKKSKNN